MKVQVQDLSPVKKRMDIEIPPDDVNREMEKVVRRYAREVRVPGFRRGHVPPAIVRQRFARELEEEVKERLIGEYHTRAVEEKGLRPLHNPIVEEVEYRAGQPLRFRTLFEVKPSIQLGQYRGLVFSRPAAGITEQDVDGALESLRESAARFLPVDPRPIEEGDHVVVDLAGRMLEGEQEEFRRESVMIHVGASENFPEFNETLMGASPGEEKVLQVSYPADFGAKNLAGRRVEYTLKAREIKRRELPPLDGDFALEMGEKDGLAALQGRLRRDLEAARERNALREAREEALRQLIEAHDFDLPEVMVEEQLKRQMEEIVRSLVARRVDLARIQMDWKEVRERELSLARKRVRGMLVLEEIARREGMQVADEELAARIEQDARELGVRPEALRGTLEKEGSVQALISQLVREKALDFVLNEATIRA